MDLSVVVGTRPEIVKMAPVITELDRLGMDYSLIHTGQHYHREISEVFLEELGLRTPDTSMDVRSGTHAEQTAEALVGLENAFLTAEPRLVLVQGDTNTVAAAALASAKLGVDVGHVEAGLRSYDQRMPEEHNRRITDHLSAFLFAPTRVSEANLKRESVWGKVFVTGNTVIDACLRYLPIAERRSKVMEEVVFEEYCLATAHRAENVDHRPTLGELARILSSCPIPVVCPIHPRTKARLLDFGLYEMLSSSENVQLMPPKGYLDFLMLMKEASFIITDSGGIQEEATAPNIRKKVFVLRQSTERPEAVTTGFSEVVGTRASTALDRVVAYLEDPELPAGPSPFGNGDSGRRIAEIAKLILEAGEGALEETSEPSRESRGKEGPRPLIKSPVRF